jgi:prophage DNA circulation protein
MSFALDLTYPASFRGAEFFFQGASVHGGRKTVIHDYPNKDFRKVEDLGNSPRRFDIRGIITGFFYADAKKALETALTTPGIGVLVHPFLGNISAACTGFTVNERLQKINIADYSMQFAETNDGITPQANDNSNTIIANLYQELYDFIKNDLNGQYIAKFARNIAAAGQKLSDLSDTLNLIGTTVSSLDLNNTEFRNTNSNFADNVFKIAGPDGNIGGNVSDLISTFDGLSADGQTRFTASAGLVDFGTIDRFVTFPSEKSEARTSNAKFINGAVNALSFMNMVDSAKDIDYLDSEELDETADLVSATYEGLLSSSTADFSNELLDKLAAIRTESRKFFEQERLVVNKVLEVTTNEVPVSILSYQYTGSTDDYDALLGLNNNFNPAFIEGIVKVLES